MGVQGLASLLENHQRIYRDVQFMKRRLVIDGYNLLHLLYFNSGLDQIRGGEYAAFEELVERFVKALRDCKISPYVILDGGSDVTHRKDETLMARAVERIKRAHRAAAESKQEHVLPQMAKLVFKQTLARLKVPMAQCYGEADQEIAALAKDWECPVLSNDSDFFIFDSGNGLLPISHFQWQSVQKVGSQSFIPSKIYCSSSFCIVFEIKPQLLPAFAVLAGNDYVKLQRTEAPIRWTQFAPAVNGTQPNRLEGLLCWLKDFLQPQDAFEAALGLMGELSKDRRAEVEKDLNLGLEGYQLPLSSLKKFFLHGVPPPFTEDRERTTCPVPDWALRPLTQARVTSDILDVLLLRSISLSPSVDLEDKPSANLTSRPIRQVMYRLLLGKGQTLRVTEHDRDGLELKSVPVKPAASRIAQELQLQTLDQVEPSVRLQLLLETLGVPEDRLTGLKPHLRLLVAVTCYWLRNAKPAPDETLLKALLLGASHGESMRRRAAAEKRLHRLKLDTDVSHLFNQWQDCLKQSVHLNQLLGLPLPEPRIARCYEGSLVHELVHMMKTGQKLKTLLQSTSYSRRQYHSMLAVAQRLYAPRPSRQKRRSLKDEDVSLKGLLSLLEEEEVSSAVRAHEDLRLEEKLSVRTRYRVKERSSRCDHLILRRKKERRGRDFL
ncbi:protein asteroid homolog 1-like [Xyrichtys novacula]|uniref:Protein asteroid homolog 1-like n=1 Tax=Xyrichtys novacula TaxID=13765 RepID=A0AAV1FNV9_XYRNO|nr:protein asteroid homolog 1-like [Xyrichtys novacula]